MSPSGFPVSSSYVIPCSHETPDPPGDPRSIPAPWIDGWLTQINRVYKNVLHQWNGDQSGRLQGRINFEAPPMGEYSLQLD